MIFSARVEVERDLGVEADTKVIVHYTPLFKTFSAKTSLEVVVIHYNQIHRLLQSKTTASEVAENFQDLHRFVYKINTPTNVI